MNDICVILLVSLCYMPMLMAASVPEKSVSADAYVAEEVDDALKKFGNDVTKLREYLTRYQKSSGRKADAEEKLRGALDDVENAFDKLRDFQKIISGDSELNERTLADTEEESLAKAIAYLKALAHYEKQGALEKREHDIPFP